MSLLRKIHNNFGQCLCHQSVAILAQALVVRNLCEALSVLQGEVFLCVCGDHNSSDRLVFTVCSSVWVANTCFLFDSVISLEPLAEHTAEACQHENLATGR